MRFLASCLRKYSGWICVAILVVMGVNAGVKMSTTGLRVKTEPAGAKIKVSGEGMTALWVRLLRANREVKGLWMRGWLIPGNYRVSTPEYSWEPEQQVRVEWGRLSDVSRAGTAGVDVDVRDWSDIPLRGYEVTVNGQLMKVSSAGLVAVKPGDVLLGVSAQNYAPYKMPYSGVACQMKRLTIRPTPLPGRLKVKVVGPENYAASINGSNMVVAGEILLPPGRNYQIDVRAEGFAKAHKTIDLLLPGEEKSVVINMLISLDVPEAYASIQAAIDAARGGETVHVAAGTYRENIVLKSGVKLAGAGSDGAVVSGRGGGPALRVANCSKGAISGFTFVLNDESASKTGGVVVLMSGSDVEMRDCTILSGTLAGLDVSGGSPRITKCVLERSGNGAIFRDGTTALIEESILRHNRADGLRVEGRGTIATVRLNEFLLNGGSGISAATWASGTMVSNSSIGNQSYGIHLEGGSITPRLVANTCASNGLDGVLVDGTGSASLVSNVCVDNKTSGITVRGKGMVGTLSENEASGNATHGILITDFAGALLSSNRCSRNHNSGIHVDQGGSPLNLFGNISQANWANGIHVEGGVKALLEDNRCEENQNVGIQVRENHTVVQCRRNICGMNGSGIEIRDWATGDVEGNQCFSNRVSGIAIVDAANGRVKKNSCDWNGSVGIMVQGIGTIAEVDGNYCRNNGSNSIGNPGGRAGILFQAGTMGRLFQNVCERNDKYGVFLSRDMTNSMSYRGNSIAGNTIDIGLHE